MVLERLPTAFFGQSRYKDTRPAKVIPKRSRGAIAGCAAGRCVARRSTTSVVSVPVHCTAASWLLRFLLYLFLLWRIYRKSCITIHPGCFAGRNHSPDGRFARTRGTGCLLPLGWGRRILLLATFIVVNSEVRRSSATGKETCRREHIRSYSL